MLGLKLMGSALVIISGTSLGFWYSGCLLKRIRQLKLLEKYMLLLQGEIRYGRTPLPEAFAKLARKSEGAFSLFFAGTARRMSAHEEGAFSRVFAEEMEQSLSGSFLKREEKEMLLQLGESLSFTDCDTKLSMLSLFIQELSALCMELEQQYRVRTRLSRLSGVAGGIFLVVVLF